MGEVLESQSLTFEISDDGSYQALDRLTGVTWHSNPYARRFGSTIVNAGDQPRHLSLDKFQVSKEDRKIVMRYVQDDTCGLHASENMSAVLLSALLRVVFD